MSDNEYLTVAQFAGEAGVSRQAVYTALQSTLSSYVKDVDGKKMLDRSALLIYSGGKNRAELQSNIDNAATELSSLRQRVNELEQTIIDLYKQIDTLTNSNAHLSTDNTDLRGKLAQLESAYREEQAARNAESIRHAQELADVNSTALNMLSEQTAQATAEREHFQRQLDEERAARIANDERHAEQVASLVDSIGRAQALQHEAQALQHEAQTVTAAAIAEPATSKRSLWDRILKK